MNTIKARNSIGNIKLLVLLGIVGFMLVFYGCMKNRMPGEPTPVDRPQVNNSNPPNAQLIFPVNSLIKLYFTEKMDLNTMPNRFIVQDINGDSLTGSYSRSDTAVVFTPEESLNKSTVYRIILKGRVRDIYENSIQFNSRAILDDTTVILSHWFYTEGAYSENGFNHIYVRDRSQNNIYVYSYLDSLISTIPSLSAPQGMTVSPDGSYLLVSNTGKNELDFINSSTFQVDNKVSLPQNPSSIITNSNYAYVVSDYGKAITKIDIQSKSIDKTFSENFYPGKITVSTDGSTLFTFDQLKLDLVAINSDDGTVLRTLNNAVTQLVSGNIAFDKSTQKLYICDTKGNQLMYTNVNLSSLNVAYTFPTGSGPNDVCFDDNYVYVAAGNSLYKLDKKDYSFIAELDFSNTVKSLMIVPTGDVMYAVLPGSIDVVDVNSFFLLKEIDLTTSGIEGVISSPNKY